MNSVSGSAVSNPGAPARKGPASLDLGTFDPRRTLRFIRTGLALLVALVVLVCALVLWRAWLTQIAEAETQVQTTARILERSTSATLDKVRIALSSASDQFEAQLAGGGVDPKSVWAIVDKAAAHASEIQRIVVFDLDGKQVCGQPIERCLNLNVGDREYFRILQARPETPASLYGPFASVLDGQLSLVLAKALSTPSQPFAGVIIAVVPVESLRPLVQASTLGPHGAASLRTADMELLARAPELPEGGPISVKALISDALQRSLAKTPDGGVYRSITPNDGTDRVMAYRRLPTYPIYVLVGEATKDFLDGWRQALYWTGGFLLLFFTAVAAIHHVARNSLKHQVREQRLYNEAPCGYHTLDPDGVYRTINATELSWLGCTREDVVGKLRPSDFYTPEGREAFAHNYSVLKTTGRLDDVEADLVSTQGQVRRVLVSAIRVSDRHGQFLHSNSVMYDVTALHAARMELVALNAEQRAMLDNDLVGIIRSRNGVIVWANKGMDRILGYATDEWLGKPVAILYPDDAAYRDMAEQLAKHSRSDGIFRRQVQMKRKDGSIIWIDGAGLKLTAAGDETMSILTDITELKKAEEARLRTAELEAQNQVLRETSKLKDEFVSNLSHELRTPLNSVIGFSHLLISSGAGASSDKHERYLRQINDSGQHLLGMVQTMLDFAKTEAGKLTLVHEPVDVRGALDEVIEMLGPKCRRLGVEISASVDDALEDVSTDRLRLRQILLNMAGNAVKFSRTGGLVEMRAYAPSSGHWCVDIADKGIGIAEGDLKRLFVPFQQLSAGNTKTYGGTGLGLALVRRIALALGGDVTVRSELGKGSVFTLTLPHAPTRLPVSTYESVLRDSSA